MPTYARHRLDDPKLDAFMRCLFYRDPRWVECDTASAEVIFTRICTLPHMGYDSVGNPLTQFRDKTLIVLDYQDWWSNDWIGDADINRPRDFGYKDALANGNKIVYLKLQINDPSFYAAYQSESTVILSCPILLGGGRRWIGCPDPDSTYLFENQITPPDAEPYVHDVAFINSIDSMPWRASIADVLDSLSKRYNVFCSRSVRNEFSEKATIPIAKSFAIHRRSAISISSNGAGMWCLKDGELFNNGCFILREQHKNISLNPLTPKFGEHWEPFTLATLEDKIDYWLMRPAEIDKIRRAGHAYFRQGIYGAWAKTYTDRTIAFLETKDPFYFDDLLVRRS